MAKFIRFEVVGNWEYFISQSSPSIGGNDGVFEGSEEHWNSKSGDFAQQCFFKIELLML